MLAKLTSHFSGVTSSEMAFQELIRRHFGKKDAKMKPGICIFNTLETIKAHCPCNIISTVVETTYEIREHCCQYIA